MGAITCSMRAVSWSASSSTRTTRDTAYLGRWRFEVRHLERLPLGTLYPAVAKRLSHIVLRISTRDM